MDENKIWRCPQCETVNQGDFCIVCGKKNVIEETVRKAETETISASDTKENIEIRPKKKLRPLIIAAVILICAIGAGIYIFGQAFSLDDSADKGYDEIVNAYVEALVNGDGEKYVSLFPEKYIEIAKTKDDFYEKVNMYMDEYLARANYDDKEIVYGLQYPSFTDVTGIEPVNIYNAEGQFISYYYNADRNDIVYYINKLADGYDFLWDGTSVWSRNGRGEWSFSERMVVENISGIDERLIIFPDDTAGTMQIRAIRNPSEYVERAKLRATAKEEFGDGLESCEIVEKENKKNAELLNKMNTELKQYGIEASDARQFETVEKYSDWTAHATRSVLKIGDKWYAYPWWLETFVY